MFARFRESLAQIEVERLLRFEHRVEQSALGLVLDVADRKSTDSHCAPDAAASGAPSSIGSRPSSPDGGTAFTSAATSSLVAAASNSLVTTRCPALAVASTTSACCIIVQLERLGVGFDRFDARSIARDCSRPRCCAPAMMSSRPTMPTFAPACEASTAAAAPTGPVPPKIITALPSRSVSCVSPAPARPPPPWRRPW